MFRQSDYETASSHQYSTLAHSLARQPTYSSLYAVVIFTLTITGTAELQLKLHAPAYRLSGTESENRSSQRTGNEKLRV